jgi:HK97 family phage prohead protease
VDNEHQPRAAASRAEGNVPGSDGLQVRAFHMRGMPDAEKRTALFVASTDSIDSYGERVKQNWRLERFLANPVILWAHQSRELPIGQAAKVEVKDNQLEILVKFASEKANPKAEQVWQGVLEATIRGVSVGFYPHSVRWEREGDKEVLCLDDNELYELSVTPIPANPDCVAKLRARAAGDPQQTKSRERGDRKEGQSMDPIMKAALDAKDAEVAQVKALAETTNKALVEERAKSAQLEQRAVAAEKAAADEKTAAAKVATELAAEKVLREAAELALTNRDLDAIIGVKITPAEKPGLVALAKADPTAFAPHLKALQGRTELGTLGGDVLPKDKPTTTSSLATKSADDAGNALFASLG